MSSKRPSQQLVLALLVIAAIVLLAPYVGCHILTTAPLTPQTPEANPKLPASSKQVRDQEDPTADEPSHSQSKEGLDEIEQLLGH